MSKDIRIRRGLDVKLLGEARKELSEVSRSEVYAIQPTDFHGVTPKLLVKEGDEVKAGTHLFYDKDMDQVVCSSPVSGEIVEIQRGEKRKIEAIKILADREQKYVDFGSADPSSLSPEEVKKRILEAGLWMSIRQRPFDVFANPEAEPKAIFISAFDSAPLAPDNAFALEGDEEAFSAGIAALQKLTSGKVHMTFHSKLPKWSWADKIQGVEKHTISGPHPSGNVGLQIHKIDPINKGEVVWTVKPQEVVVLGRLFMSGHVDMTKVVAITGSEVKDPMYAKVLPGISMKALLEGQTKPEGNRIISGNVLTGTTSSMDGALGYYDTQVTVIPEGNYEEFLGWIAPGFGKFSNSRAYFSWLNPGKKYRLDTNTHGEKRAYVVTGEYEQVFPFDIYPVQLIKSIMIGDIEAMEGLGIYEVAPEDFALCEVVCTSKTEVQKIVREGLDLVKQETT